MIWLDWLNLGLCLFDLALWIVLALLLRRAWKRLAPALAPYLAMFARPEPGTTLKPQPVEIQENTYRDAYRDS